METGYTPTALKVSDVFVDSVCGGVDDGVCVGTHLRGDVGTAGATTDDEDGVADVVRAPVVCRMY